MCTLILPSHHNEKLSLFRLSPFIVIFPPAIATDHSSFDSVFSSVFFLLFFSGNHRLFIPFISKLLLFLPLPWWWPPPPLVSSMLAKAVLVLGERSPLGDWKGKEKYSLNITFFAQAFVVMSILSAACREKIS